MSDLSAQYLTIWLVLSIIVGAIGSTRTIGLAKSFFWSLVLSPIGGIILVLTSERKLASGTSEEVGVDAAESISLKDQMLQELKTEYQAGRLSKQEYKFAQKEVISRYPS